jgi:Kinesin motor domain
MSSPADVGPENSDNGDIFEVCKLFHVRGLYRANDEEFISYLQLGKYEEYLKMPYPASSSIPCVLLIKQFFNVLQGSEDEKVNTQINDKINKILIKYSDENNLELPLEFLSDVVGSYTSFLQSDVLGYTMINDKTLQSTVSKYVLQVSYIMAILLQTMNFVITEFILERKAISVKEGQGTGKEFVTVDDVVAREWVRKAATAIIYVFKHTWTSRTQVEYMFNLIAIGDDGQVILQNIQIKDPERLLLEHPRPGIGVLPVLETYIKLEDATSIALLSTYDLRGAFQFYNKTYFGEDSRRKELDILKYDEAKVTNKANEWANALEAKFGLQPRGLDFNSDRHAMNIGMALMAAINYYYLLKVVHSYPWVIHMFSIDNMKDFLDNQEIYKGANKLLLLQYWREAFFEPWNNVKQFMMRIAPVDGLESIYAMVQQDTKYVLSMGDNTIKDTEFISRLHVLTCILHYLSDIPKISEETMINDCIAYMKTYRDQVRKTMFTVVDTFRMIRNNAQISIYSSSQNAIMSFVRIRGNMLNYSNVPPRNWTVRYDIQQYSHNTGSFVLSYCSDLQKSILDVDKSQIHKYLFGPFTRVFYPQHTNKFIAKKIPEIPKLLQRNDSVMIMGFGISGAGKTSVLINREEKNNMAPENGIVLEWLYEKGVQSEMFNAAKAYTTQKQGKELNSIHNSKSGFSVVLMLCEQYKDPREKKYEPYNTAEWPNIIRNVDPNVAQSKFVTSQEEVTQRGFFNNGQFKKLDDLLSDNAIVVSGADEDDTIKQVAAIIIDCLQNPALRQTKPTPNNESSSRSHMIVSILVKYNAGGPYTWLHVVDLAGVENEFIDTESFITPLQSIYLGTDKDEKVEKYVRTHVWSQFQRYRKQLVNVKSGEMLPNNFLYTVYDRYLLNQSPQFMGLTDFKAVTNVKYDVPYTKGESVHLYNGMHLWLSCFLNPMTTYPNGIITINAGDTKLLGEDWSKFNTYQTYQQSVQIPEQWPLAFEPLLGGYVKQQPTKNRISIYGDSKYYVNMDFEWYKIGKETFTNFKKIDQTKPSEKEIQSHCDYGKYYQFSSYVHSAYNHRKVQWAYLRLLKYYKFEEKTSKIFWWEKDFFESKASLRELVALKKALIQIALNYFITGPNASHNKNLLLTELTKNRLGKNDWSRTAYELMGDELFEVLFNEGATFRPTDDTSATHLLKTYNQLPSGLMRWPSFVYGKTGVNLGEPTEMVIIYSEDSTLRRLLSKPSKGQRKVNSWEKVQLIFNDLVDYSHSPRGKHGNLFSTDLESEFKVQLNILVQNALQEVSSNYRNAGVFYVKQFKHIDVEDIDTEWQQLTRRLKPEVVSSNLVPSAIPLRVAPTIKFTNLPIDKVVKMNHILNRMYGNDPSPSIGKMMSYTFKLFKIPMDYTLDTLQLLIASLFPDVAICRTNINLLVRLIRIEDNAHKVYTYISFVLNYLQKILTEDPDRWQPGRSIMIDKVLRMTPLIALNLTYAYSTLKAIQNEDKKVKFKSEYGAVRPADEQLGEIDTAFDKIGVLQNVHYGESAVAYTYNKNLSDIFNITQLSLVNVDETDVKASFMGVPLSVDIDKTKGTWQPSNIYNKISLDTLKCLYNARHETGWDLVNVFDVFFTFALIIVQVENINKERDKEYMKSVENYRLERSEEGNFINRSVYALRDSLKKVTRLKARKLSTYGRSAFNDVCVFNGCHPFLDKECFVDNDKGLDYTKYDPLMAYILYLNGDNYIDNQFVVNNKMKNEIPLHVAIMSVINMSSAQQDPPAVPYIPYKKLYQTVRMYKYLFENSLHPSIYLERLHPLLRSRTEADTPTFMNDFDLKTVTNYKAHNPVALDVYTNIRGLLIEAINEITTPLDKLKVIKLYDGIIQKVEKYLEPLNKIIKNTDTQILEDQDLKVVQDILEKLQQHNNASLIGNLAFVDSLQKMGAESLCEVTKDDRYLWDLPSEANIDEMVAGSKQTNIAYIATKPSIALSEPYSPKPVSTIVSRVT